MLQKIYKHSEQEIFGKNATKTQQKHICTKVKNNLKLNYAKVYII